MQYRYPFVQNNYVYLFSLRSFISIISYALVLFARFSLRLPSPRFPREAAHLHKTSDILRVVGER